LERGIEHSAPTNREHGMAEQMDKTKLKPEKWAIKTSPKQPKKG